jgi:hypothetical protein
MDLRRGVSEFSSVAVSFNSPGRKAGDRTAKDVIFCGSTPGIPTWAAKESFNIVNIKPLE